ncbi:MAG: transcriptional repressor LexA [Coriobacteriia bacterium]|nr:transcriptional repressor LexA [Coriobacteriia bacterium]
MGKTSLKTPKASANCKEIYSIIKDFINEHNYSPTTRDIVKRTKLKSVSSVHSYIKELERRGLIYREDNKSRSISLVNNPKSVTLPVVGAIAAGSPIIAEENIIDNVKLPAELAGQGTFVLRVEGNSMIDAGILDGDNIIVRQQTNIENGDIAVCLIEDSATVKRFFKENGKYRLHPENSTLDDIIVDECQICGKVIGLYRNLSN